MNIQINQATFNVKKADLEIVFLHVKKKKKIELMNEKCANKICTSSNLRKFCTVCLKNIVEVSQESV